ncbi:MAG: long-chain fatty acid--CoA ligase [Syntrophales bacterium]|nr:long-chain fatty acid--CoA ligase [Syntrophales bacterium]MDD4339543.1 long-chain fatty acid--CoA ligase [Syntrophales bacterium]HOG07729.1 long-chain fatty acid--CoA ligase [Syntrophales bacterium]HOS76575.1 long-chain fatty acid--CoA ligase [Syntrophales bacterium]HPB70591.1 long-chain fatty acid--CoA ligase [Syntrophales bacterium]
MSWGQVNVGEWITKRALTHPDRPFLCEEGMRNYTNREFNERVNRIAHALAAWGAGRGERVAVLMANASEFLEIFFACAKTGAIMTPLNVRLAVPELVYILKDCAPRVLVYGADFADKVAEIKALLTQLPFCVRHGGDTGQDPDLARAVADFPDAEPAPSPELALDDPLFTMYTSGTTGDPKGAVLTHGNVLFAAINTVMGYGINRSYKSLVVAPLFHIGALGASALPILYAGGSLYIKGFYNAAEVLDLIVREKINYLFAVPVMFQLLAQTEQWAQADFSHVHFFIAGGAPMPLPMIQKYQTEKGVSFAQGYGMTEAFRLTSLDLEDAVRKAGSVGKEVLHVRLRIVDEQDRDVPPGEAGEIVVKGPNVFAGYWNKPAETESAMRDGWFHTGDMGRRDEEGFVYIVGRKVEMIISSGENIYPAEVERVIQALPEVREAAVVGMPDRKKGEVVAAFVLLKEGAALNAEALLEAIRDKIAYFKLPRKIIFVGDFPRNTAGKILKKDLKEKVSGSEGRYRVREGL